MQWNALVIFSGLLMTSWGLTGISRAQDVSWIRSVDEAAALAARTGKMIVISVGAEWCHYCKRMDSEVWPNRSVREAIHRGYVPLKLSDELNHELLGALQVRAFPTTLIFSSDRRFITRIEGYIDTEKMVQLLEQVRLAKQSIEQTTRNLR